MTTLSLRLTACMTLLATLPVQAQRRAADAPTPPAATRVGYINAVTVGHGMASPDGRWVIVSGWDTKDDALWILPRAGGTPRRLLDGHDDTRATFTPAGDRIFFRSSRVSRSANGSESYLVSAPFDSERGEVGAVRQIGLQPSSVFAPIVSPDGRWVAYISTAQELRVVPVNGGTERVLGKVAPLGPPGRTLSWTADSRAMEWNVPESGRPNPRRYRATIEGGTPTLIAESTPIRGPMLPDGRHTIVIRQDSSENRVLAIAALDGTTVAEVPFPDVAPLKVSHDGRFLVAVVRDQEAALRAVSTSGGASRVVVPANGNYLWPEGWTASGDVAYNGAPDGWRQASLRGRPGRELSPGELAGRATWDVISGDYAILSSRNNEPHEGRPIHLLNIATGRHRSLDEHVLVANTRGAGGAYDVDRDRFLFIVRENDALHIRAANKDGVIENIRRVPFGFLEQTTHGVYGRRFAYLEQQRDTVWLMITEGPDAQPRRVIRVPGNSARGELAWSHDGNRIAIAGSDTDQLHVVDLGGPGRPATLRTHVLPLSYYYEIFWLAGDGAVTVVTEPKDGSGANIARIDIDTGRTTILTTDDPNPVWGHLVSPDGSTVVYPSEVHKGSSIWVYDIERILRENRRRP